MLADPQVTRSDSPEADVPPDEQPAPRQKTVSKTILNFWIDAALLLSVLFLVWVSAMMQVVFPTPTSADKTLLWGLSFNDWRDLQFFSLCVCALLALEHVVLHWKWICSVIATRILRVKSRPDEATQAVYGVIFFIGILLTMLAGIIAAVCTVEY